jgi:hypothetical protein
MKTDIARCLGLCLALAITISPVLVGFAGPKSAAKKEAKTQYFKGKVVPLADLLKKSGVKLDPEASPHWLALVTADGKVYPLIKDDGSRIFFNDPKVLNRPMRITGKLFKDSRLLQVLTVHSYVKGKLHDIYYWCDICAIRRSHKQICDCCGGPMELREVPVEK